MLTKIAFSLKPFLKRHPESLNLQIKATMKVMLMVTLESVALKMRVQVRAPRMSFVSDYV